MIKAGLFRCLAYRKLLLVEHPYDLSGQLRFELFNVGVLITKVTKNVTTAFDGFQFPGHRSCSFNWLIRERIKSISFFGILIHAIAFVSLPTEDVGIFANIDQVVRGSMGILPTVVCQAGYVVQVQVKRVVIAELG